MVCEEELYAGRWVNRYWTSTGKIEPKVHLQGQSETRAGLPNRRISAWNRGPESCGKLEVDWGQVVTMSGSQLLQNGIPVRLDENLSSELLVIEQR